jgi:hypothetical protein
MEAEEPILSVAPERSIVALLLIAAMLAESVEKMSFQSDGFASARSGMKEKAVRLLRAVSHGSHTSYANYFYSVAHRTGLSPHQPEPASLSHTPCIALLGDLSIRAGEGNVPSRDAYAFRRPLLDTSGMSYDHSRGA